MSEITHVAVAVILNDNNEVCISLRHADSHQGGRWEFPGGKIERHETVGQSLVREIQEELGLTIQQSRPLITINHDYHDKRVCLRVQRCFRWGCAQSEKMECRTNQESWLVWSHSHAPSGTLRWSIVNEARSCAARRETCL